MKKFLRKNYNKRKLQIFAYFTYKFILFNLNIPERNGKRKHMHASIKTSLDHKMLQFHRVLLSSGKQIKPDCKMQFKVIASKNACSKTYVIIFGILFLLILGDWFLWSWLCFWLLILNLNIDMRKLD